MNGFLSYNAFELADTSLRRLTTRQILWAMEDRFIKPV